MEMRDTSMDLNLKGRKVLITGAGDGIGRALALAFAAEGAHVAGCARSESRLASLQAEAEGSGHFFHPVDLTHPGDLQAYHDKAIENLGGLDVLVNNAGLILKMGNFFDISDEDWQRSFDINLMAAVRLTRLFIPSLRHSGSPSIINISSIAAERPVEVIPHYNAMKAALSNWSQSLAQTLAPDKIRVNTVSPGPVWTRSWENEARAYAKSSGQEYANVVADIRAQRQSSLLLKRMGTPEDMVGMVLLLASDRTSWITGTDIRVDGGST
jgi:NAD(P)-dependent dehydrogenase (short-subunit alcohol dehydrogenase family)